MPITVVSRKVGLTLLSARNVVAPSVRVISKTLSLISLVFLLTACGQPKLSDLPTEYVKTLQSIGFQPVYPPREGLQVGDVFLRAVYQPDPTDPHKNFRILVGSIPIGSDRARDFADSRILYVKTSDDGLVEQLDYEVHTAWKRRRMLQVAFPNVTARVATGANLGFFDAIRSMVGVAAQVTRVTVSFPDVRFMWLPLALRDNFSEVLKHFVDDIQPSTFMQRIVLQNETDFPGCADTDYDCYYTIITAVYYVRRMTYTFGDASSLAASAGLLDNPIKNENGEIVAAPLPPLRVVVDTKAGQGSSPEEISTNVAEALGKEFAKATKGSAGFRGMRSAQRSFKYERTFESPVAIAWEGFHITAPMTSRPKGIGPASGVTQ